MPFLCKILFYRFYFTIKLEGRAAANLPLGHMSGSPLFFWCPSFRCLEEHIWHYELSTAK